jgi:hypothetical protein
VVFSALLIVVLWYVIAPSRQWYNKVDIPLIRADQAPYKIKVAHQGVPEVKHQDKLVYGRIRADEHGPVTEHILPEPEAPRIHLAAPEAPLKMVEEYAPNDRDPAGVLQQKVVNEGEPQLASIEDLLAEVPEEASVPSSQKAFIQLGSLKSYELAEAEWERLSKKHPELLKDLKPLIQKVDLGEDQGIYYRLRTGPIEGAEKVAAGLKDQKVDCVVVH